MGKTKQEATAIGSSKSKTKTPTRPVWKGPEEDGITQSLLSRFLCYRERFRLLVVKGLQPAPSFNHRLEFGNMWHVCEEAFAKAPGDKYPKESHEEWMWETRLKEYAQGLVKQFRESGEQIDKWYRVCKAQFPIYIQYWAKHPDVKARTPLLQEQTFSVPYGLPSGRVVTLRGKWDSVDLIGKGKSAGVYLQENKTKGDVKEEQLLRQLSSGFHLQTMFYLVALQGWQDPDGKIETMISPSQVKGVRYNVVRRPLSGGRHSISPHKQKKGTKRPETQDEFYDRLQGLIREDPGFFFYRWRVEVSPQDIERFRVQCLNPILEQLWDWWDWAYDEAGRMDGLDQDRRAFLHGDGCGPNFRYPYGVYNPLTEGGEAELDRYLNEGSELGLVREANLFKELG